MKITRLSIVFLICTVQLAIAAQLHSSDKDYVPKVVVKFHDNISLPYEDGVEKKLKEFLDAKDVEVWNEILKQFPGLTLRRAITSITPKAVDAILAKAKRRNPKYIPANFLTYFVIPVPHGIDAKAVAKALSDWPPVKKAYVKNPPTPPPSVTLGVGEGAMQGYLGPAIGPAPMGVDAKFAWQFPGGDGAATGLQFIDLEQGWKLDHEDLPPGISVLNNPQSQYHVDHGTAVLGIVLAVAGNVNPSEPNRRHVVGIAPHLESLRVGVVSEADDDRYNAVMLAISMLDAGSVLLLEAQDNFGDEFTPDFRPVEHDLLVFEAIELATATGVVIVEPAGNGKQDLDQYDYIFGTRDSGAIMVAAANSESRARTNISNFGKRVNCFAWGDNVHTLADTGYGVIGMTSAASAIIAGTALVVQGIAQANHLGDPTMNYRFPPTQLRTYLCNSTTGTHSANGTEPIGIMPNLKNIICSKLSCDTGPPSPPSNLRIQ
jgi:hypothetical protein